MSIDRTQEQKQEGEIPKIESDNPNNRPIDLEKESLPERAIDNQAITEVFREEAQRRKETDG